jgi:hypothetical protein
MVKLTPTDFLDILFRGVETDVGEGADDRRMISYGLGSSFNI